MSTNKTASIVSFVLTLQFLATLGWIVASWGSTGLGGLTGGMADYFLRNVEDRFYFTLINLYNVSFGLTAVSLVVLLQKHITVARTRYFLAILWLTAAAALYVASGIIPIVGADAIAMSGRGELTQVIVVVVTGLVLAATFASGVGLFFAASALLADQLFPTLLCFIMFGSAAIEVAEYSSTLLLILDPALGTVWSIWLGISLWNRESATHSDATRVRPSIRSAAV